MLEEKKNNKDGRAGRCYEMALLFQQKHPEFTLVHGYITHPVHGFQIDHAWCEIDGVTYEPTGNKLYPTMAFSIAFEPEVDKRYTYKETLTLMHCNLTYGPWHEVKPLDLSKYYNENGEIKNEYS